MSSPAVPPPLADVRALPPAAGDLPSAGRRRRRGAGAALLLAGTGLVGSGVLSAWQATSNVSTGALTATDAAVQVLDAAGSTFASGVPDLLPGDYFYRYVDLRNQGTATSPYVGQVNAGGDLGSTLLARVESCPTSWTVIGSSTSCTGGATVVAAEQSLANPLAVDYGNIAPGVLGSKHLRFRFAFSDGAASTLMGKTGTISATFTSTLVGGRDRTTS